MPTHHTATMRRSSTPDPCRALRASQAWGELNVGSRGIFADAGFTEVSHPTLRRVVMRIDF